MQRVCPLDRTKLIYKVKPKDSNKNDSITRCILTYSNHSKAIQGILLKYWSLLTNDTILTNYVTTKPSITFRRCACLRDNLVRSHYRSDLGDPIIKGTVPCGGCGACSSLDTHDRVKLPNGKSWTSRHLATCSTMGVYLLQCPCHSFYVGKTSRTWRTRILEHLDSAKSGYYRTAIGRHVAITHNYNFQGFKFLPLAVIPPPERGGDWSKLLLQQESKWIFRLNATSPPGLNEGLSFAPFL